VLNWEAAYGKAFQIQRSDDGSNWTTVYSTSSGTGGVQDVGVSGSGRYVRMYGTQRGTQYGYSLWEFQVYGS
jgi:beta-glucosidase